MRERYLFPAIGSELHAVVGDGLVDCSIFWGS